MKKSTDSKTQKRSVTFSVETLEQLEKLAARQKKTTSDLIRSYVDKGLSVDGHKENIDLIATIIRQEIKSQLDVQIDRLAKMNMKIGKISAGLYYLVLKLLLKCFGATKSQSLKELATETRKMGVKYMQLRDFQVNDYLEDEDMIYNDADLL